MANTYHITITGKYQGTADVEASHPSVAVKRLLDGGHEAGYKFATVGARRVKLAKGEAINIRVERI